MRVLFITHYGKLYGANISLLNLIIILKKNFDVEPIVLTNRLGDFTERLTKENIQFVKIQYCNNYVNYTKKFYRSFSFIKKLIKYPSYYFVYKQIRRIGKFDVVHSNSSVIDIGYYLSRMLKIPHVWHIREFANKYNLKSISSTKSDLAKYIDSKKIIAISNSIETMIFSKSRKIDVELIPNGVVIPLEYRKVYFKSGKINFCIVGIISEEKNQFEVVKACALLKSKGYSSFVLYIIGDGDEVYINKIKRYIIDNGLNKNIFFTGYSNDIHTDLKSMDIGIVCSLKEAFGRVTVEYMSNYLPVIGTNSGGTSELINNSENGYLYEVGDINELAGCMEKFINSPDIIQQMGAMGRLISLNFNAEKNAEKIYFLYREILNSVGK